MTGKLVRFGLSTPGTGRAARFVCELFGWRPQPAGGGCQFPGGTPSGGLAEGEPGTTRACFEAGDIEAAARRVRDLGGDSQAVEDLPGIGRPARCPNDQGTAFSVFQPAAESGDRR